MSVPMPSGIAATVDHLRHDLGEVEVVAEHLSGRRWRVTATSDRVRVWVLYEAHTHGRVQVQASELYIDDVQVPKATSYAHLVHIFADPDNGRQDYYEPPDPQEVAVDEAPDEVRDLYRQVSGKLQRGLQLVVRRSHRYWYLCVEGDGVELRLRMYSQLMNPKRPTYPCQTVLTKKRPIELFINGEDLTHKVQGRLDKALGLIAGHQSAPAAPAIGHAAPAAVNTSVQVRKQTVIRT